MPMNKSEFFESMVVMQAVWGHAVPDTTMDIYWNIFRKLEPGRFKAAAEKLIKTWVPTTSQPFPVPATIFEAVGEFGRSSAVRVVALLREATVRADSYVSVSFNDPALHSVIARFGGWIAVCGWTDHDWQIQEGRFIEAYQSARSSGDRGPLYFPGTHEINNSLKNYDKHIAPVQVFDREKFISTGKISISEVPQRHLLGVFHASEQIEHRTGDAGPEQIGEII